MKNKKIKINIIGDFFGQTGYCHHVRELANALDKIENIDICMTTFNLPQNWQIQCSDREFKMFKRSRDDCEIIICITLPYIWKQFMCENKKFIGFCIFEGDRVPKSWINIFNDDRCTGIFIPSNHVMKAIKNTYSETDYFYNLNKFHIIPHGFNPKIFKTKSVERKDNKFTFFTDGGWSKGWNDRKGISHLIKSFCEVFSAEENVKLVVKVNSSYGCDLNKSLQELDIQNNNPPKVNIILDNLTNEQMSELYNQADCYVSTSLAEGFNLGCLQAQACGIPSIATSFGGQTDYINRNNGWILEEGKMEQVEKQDLLYEGVKWKVPDINEIKQMLRYCYNNKEEVKEKGKQALENSKTWTWNDSAKKIYEIFSKL